MWQKNLHAAPPLIEWLVVGLSATVATMSSRHVIVVLAAALIGCGGCKDPQPADAGNGRDLGGADVAETGPDGGPDAAMDERAAITAIPQTSSMTIAALREPVHVVRTAGNVPHIYASNLHDAHVAAGFVLARDRFFELDIASRLATGEVSSLLGGFGLSADLNARGGGMTHVADRLMEQMDPQTGETLDAFAAGINAYAELVRAGELPPPSEYELAAPLVGARGAGELLRTIDRRALAGFMAFAIYESSFSNVDVGSELVAQSLVGKFAGGGLDDLRQAGVEQDLFPGMRPIHEISVAGGWGLNGGLQTNRSLRHPVAEAVGRELGALPPSLHARLRRTSSAWDLWFGTRNSGDRGSNAWAVSSEGTADGGTLLAGDGHLALGIPTLFFQMGVDVRTFGDDPLRVMGLYLPGFPYLAVGTNGDVAWSQTYPRADVMDWYREEIQLDAGGLPQASMFEGQWRSLVRIDETYDVGKVLTDDPYIAEWPRWTTFDGRFLREIEGRTVADLETEVLAPGESIVAMEGGFVVPGDEDGDGVITAISLDFTAFDVGNLPPAIDGLQRSKSVEEFQEHLRSFVGYAQNYAIADRHGSVGYTNFTATPCREYLPKDGDGNWVAGADPQRLLDGTTYGAFEVPMKDGRVVTGDSDPQKCMIDYDVFPRVLRQTGWVSTANNDPAGATFDGSLTNDPAYIGGPWVPGYRARAIADGLDEAAARGATADDMAAIQGKQRSLVGIELAPVVIDVVARVKATQAADPATLSAGQLRALDLYTSRAAALDEAAVRLQAWLDAGAVPASGVNTFYDDPTEQDRTDAVATMVFNVWLRKWIAEVFADEDIDALLERPGRARGAMMRALKTLVDGRGEDNPMGLASWNPDTQESVFFDDRTTADVVEEHDETVLSALVASLELLESEPQSGGNGGFGTTDMNAWLWGLRHRVVLDSLLAAFGADTPAVNVIAKEFAIDTTVLPLAEELAADDPRKGIRWFPRPGDHFGVDAANPSFFGDDNFDYRDGPVMRMVIQLAPDGTISGRNVIPAGQSGLNDSPFFADQAALWLGNDALPIQWAPIDVAAAAVGREVLTP